MNEVFVNELAQMSEQDKELFAQIAKRLSLVDGEVGQLEQQDQLLIKQLEEKYRAKPSKTSINDSSSQQPDSQQIDLLETPFALYVRQMMARDLVSEYPFEVEAVHFTFTNKWMPLECRQAELAEEIYNRFEADIVRCNQWRNDLVSIEQDKGMAVGLAWFMVVYQLYQRLTEEGDPTVSEAGY